jgi:hypothetical protein
LLPQALVFLTLMAIAALRDPIQPYGVAVGAPVFYLPFLAVLACWVLVVSLIQEERLIGHEQYWLTRPYSRRDLIAAKALFLLAFVNLPLFVCQFASVAQAGLSPWHWLPALLWRQVFFSIFCILPAVALGAVTRHFGQVALAAIGAFVLLRAGTEGLVGNGYADWGGYDWIRTCGAALVLAGGMAAAIALQYTRRRTALSRGIVAATLALTALTAYAPFVGAAFAIQALFSRQAIPASTLRISYDASRAGTHPTQSYSSSNDPDGVRLEIPLRVGGVPGVDSVGADLTSIDDQAPAGAWRSGWLAFHAFHGLSEGKAWLTAFVAPEFYERNKDAPVRLSGAVEFTLYRRVGTIAVRSVNVIPDVGLCQVWRSYMQNSAELHDAACYSPFSKLAIEPRGSMDTQPLGGSYAPFPTSLGFMPFDRSGWSFIDSEPAALDLPTAHIQRRFEAGGVLLRDFRFR